MLRAELSVHTKLSDDISIIEPQEIILVADEFDVSAIAFTNLNNVQDFYNIARCKNPYGVKIIYGANVCYKQNGQYFYANLLVKNQKGLKNLYKIISAMKTDDGTDFVDFQSIKDNRENLIVGFCATKKLCENIEFFDFCEISPTDITEEKEFYKNLCETLDIPIVATSNCHYLDMFDELKREIILSAKAEFKDNSKLYLHTTEEMLKEFSYLGKDMALDVVVNNSNAIADIIEEVNPLNDKMYLPKIENAFEELEQEIYKNAKAIYGEILPKDVQLRLQEELSYLKREEFATRFAISHKLAKHFNELGFEVCSRGYVGSTLLAFLLKISSVNPLSAHYYCPKCHYYESSSEAVDGFDLPKKDCPNCGEVLKEDGHNIPFESYFWLYKMISQNISINVPSSRLKEGFAFLKEMFGKEFLALCGTIVKTSIKSAQDFLECYKQKTGENFEEDGESFEQYLCEEISDVKLRNGTHPYGVLIIPKGMEFEDLTPIRKIDSLPPIKYATHFEFHDILDNVIRHDVLPYNTLDILNDLEKATGKTIDDVDFADEKIYELFSNADVSSIAEFDREFVTDLLLKLKPKTFNELVKICGFSHGTNMWIDNAEFLLENGVDLEKLPTSKEEIFEDFVRVGVNRESAFEFTNAIRMGKLARGLVSKQMQDNIKTFADKISPWYYDFCSKILYVFPKAHAVEYVSFAVRLAWFKIYYPEEFKKITEKYN